MTECRYDQNNRLNCKDYYKNGNLESETSYEGFKFGIREMYSENGKFKTYRGIKPVGIWKFYHEDGRLRSKRTYENGKLVENIYL